MGDKTSKAGKANAAAEDDDIVRLHSFSVALQRGNGTDGVFFYDFDRALPARSISCRARH
jgi:hypothetical protein